MVCPTKSGDISDLLDQVLITDFLPDLFMSSTRFSSLNSIKGPFFNDLLIVLSQLFFAFFNNEPGSRILLPPGLHTFCIQTFTRSRMTSGSPSFTTTHWMVYRVHNHTTNTGSATQPTGTACFS